MLTRSSSFSKAIVGVSLQGVGVGKLVLGNADGVDDDEAVFVRASRE